MTHHFAAPLVLLVPQDLQAPLFNWDLQALLVCCDLLAQLAQLALLARRVLLAQLGLLALLWAVQMTRTARKGRSDSSLASLFLRVIIHSAKILFVTKS